MIQTFWFVRLGEGDVCKNVAWKLQKCCGVDVVMETWNRFGMISQSRSIYFKATPNYPLHAFCLLIIEISQKKFKFSGDVNPVTSNLWYNFKVSKTFHVSVSFLTLVCLYEYAWNLASEK